MDRSEIAGVDVGVEVARRDDRSMQILELLLALAAIVTALLLVGPR